MFNKITEIGKKMLKDVGEIDWDDFKEQVDPLLNKKMELFKYIEEAEKKRKLIRCDMCGSTDMFDAKRKRRNGEIYIVKRCNKCGSCNMEGEEEDD